MANNETTTKFKVDISELKKAMQDAKKSVAVANSEFKAVSSTMDDWTKSSEGISAKLKQLDSNLKNQKTILKSLEDQYEQVAAAQGEGSKAANDLKIKINNQKAVVNQTEREISKYESTLDEVSEAEKIASKTGKDVADVLNDVGNESKDAGDGFTVFKGAIADFIGSGLSSLVGGLKDAAGNLLGLADETREYRTEMAKLDSAFVNSGHSSETASKTYSELQAILGDTGQSVEAANMLAKLCSTEEELSEWTNIAAGIYGTFGNSLPIEGLTEAANETAKTGALTGSLADALNWAGVNEDDFNKKLEKCNTEQERQALITDTLNGLYAETGEAYKKNNADLLEANSSQERLTETYAKFGEKAEPIMSTIRDGAANLLDAILELIDGANFEAVSQAVSDGFDYLIETVLPAVKKGFQWILDNKDYLIAGLGGIAAGFVAFKVVTLLQGIVSAFKSWKIATEGMTVAQRLLNLVMAANPVALITTLIVGLVAAFVILWKKSDSFRQFWINLWTKIKDFVGKAVASISKFFKETIPKALNSMLTFLKQLPSKVSTWLSNTISKVSTWSRNMINKAKETARNFINRVIEFIKQLPSKIWTWLVNVVSKVIAWRNNMVNKAKDVATKFVTSIVNYIKQLPSKIWNFLRSALSKVTSWGSSLVSKGKEAARKLLDAVVNKVKEIPNKLKSIGKDLVKGLWNGISNMTSWIKDKIKGFGKSVVNGLKDFFGIKSPSRLMADEVGKWLPEGIAVGIDKNAKSVMSSMKDLTMNTVGAARNGLSTSTSGNGLTGGVVNNFTQVINSPKQLNRLDIYRQSKNLLGYAGGGY